MILTEQQRAEILQTVKQTIHTQMPYLAQTIQFARRWPYFKYKYARTPESFHFDIGVTLGETSNDAALIDRLISSFLKRNEDPTGMWSGIFIKHIDIVEAFRNFDRTRIEQILREPLTSDLFYGFDSLAKSLRYHTSSSEIKHDASLTFDALVTLAEAIGARNMDNPETYVVGRKKKIFIDDVIKQIENHLGFDLLVPNPYPKESGIVTKRGVISYRVPQAMYQAWRISKLLENIENPKVLEIGGGLGRTAFYAKQLGIKDYTIVDIPISSLAQGYFIGRTLGDDNVSLFGETSKRDQIKILSPSSFLDCENRFDLIINADSLTEFGRPAAGRYVQNIQKKTNRFLSINHERNEYSVSELLNRPANIRMHYWMRKGYAEELFLFD